MEKNVLLSNAQGNFSVELSPDEARNVVRIQKQQERMSFSKFSLMAAMLGAGAGLQFGGGVSYRPSGERCIECGQQQPPGKPRKCKACR